MYYTTGGCRFSVRALAETKTDVTIQPFGRMRDGTPVELFTPTDGPIEARIITYSGILVSLTVPARNGRSEDVVLGYDSLDEYVANNNARNPAFFGAIIGRYANRIARGRFNLSGNTYSLPRNNGENSLHGGPHGFYNVVWNAKPIESGIELSSFSKDGEEGYPGNLSATVRYTLNHHALRIEYSATTDKETVVNLTNHAYFNLGGRHHGNILGHQLTLHASHFTPVDSNLIPTDELKPVGSTPFDFRRSTAIGDRIESDDQQLHLARGYDHNWALDSQAETWPRPPSCTNQSPDVSCGF
jgi:aldose 1-epimerase